MADTSTKFMQTTLKIVSDEWNIFGPTFRMDIPATEAGDGLYKISKSDWDATIGPILDRLHTNITGGSKNGDLYRPVANGYLAMEGKQTEALHELLCAFGASADPDRLKSYPGTPETNPHLARLTTFAATLNGPEQAVLVSETQLQALANIARKAIEYAREGARVTPETREFYDAFASKPGIRYSHGLLHALT